MIVISYGITKSGSTLAFEIARRVAKAAGFSQARLPDGLVDPGHNVNFVSKISLSRLSAIAAHVGADGLVVLKTHGRPDPEVVKTLKKRDARDRFRVHAVFRDPREVALSLVDAGAAARAKERIAFCEIETLEHAKEQARRQFRTWRIWTSLPHALQLYYDDLAFHTETAVERIARHMGLPCDPIKVATSVLKRKERTQFNKGVMARWQTDMSPEHSAAFEQAFSDYFTAIRRYGRRLRFEELKRVYLPFLWRAEGRRAERWRKSALPGASSAANAPEQGANPSPPADRGPTRSEATIAERLAGPSSLPVTVIFDEPNPPFDKMLQAWGSDADPFFRRALDNDVAGTAGPVMLVINGQNLETSTERLEAALGRREVRAGLTSNLILCIDNSGEGSAFRANHFSNWHRILTHHGIAPTRIVYITQNEGLSADYSEWRESVRQHLGFQVFVIHTFLYLQAAWVRRLLSNPDEFAKRKQAILTAPNDVARRARFLCLNNKPRDHRMIIVGRLARRGFLSSAFVSFASAPERRGKIFDAAHGLLTARNKHPKFAEDLDSFAALLPRIPLRVPGDSLDQWDRVVSDVPLNLYGRSLISLVGETRMNSIGRQLHFTEKSVKPLAGGHPLLVAGHAGTLRLLRDHGFATFSHCIDEGYDGIGDPEERLEAMLQEVERLGVMAESELAKFLQQCLPSLLHNLEYFLHGLPTLLLGRLANFARAVDRIAAGAVLAEHGASGDKP
jgi:hypothetical protein